jgi:S1-C subfamily serine protease
MSNKSEFHRHWLAFVALFLCGMTIAQPRPLSSEKLFAKYKPAVVAVLVSYAGVPTAFGSGFFVSNQGELITAGHVVGDAINLDGYTVSIRTADGKTFKSVQMAKCGDDKNRDLCLLKVDFHPKSWFPLNALRKPEAGEKIYVIGHPFANRI